MVAIAVEPLRSLSNPQPVSCSLNVGKVMAGMLLAQMTVCVW